MNRFHRWYCGSWHWRRHLTGGILPQVVAGQELGAHVLELGPGRGASTAWLRERLPKLTGLELDPDLAAHLAERFDDVEIVRGSAISAPFEDGAFSGVVCTTMLHHVPTPAEQDQLFAEARRVLADGGVFCGSDSLSTPIFRLAHRGDVMNVVDPDTLPARLAAAGFDNIEVRRGSDFFTFRAEACECCDTDLPPDADDAMICTYECTFCAYCVEHCLGEVCPNCGGNFSPRPIRPAGLLLKDPPSTERIHQAGLHRD